MGKPSNKDANNAAKTKDTAEDREKQRLRQLAFGRKIISQIRANPTRHSQPSQTIVRSDGKDIVKKGQRKSKYLFAFPCLVAPVSGGKMGELVHLDTKNPILYVDFPQGRLKFFGTIMYPKNKYLTLQFPRGSGNIICEDSFDSLVVFSDVWWIGTKEENPEELHLNFPKELKQEKHAEFDFKGGAGLVADHKDIAGTQLPSKERDEPQSQDTDFKLDGLQDSEPLKTQIDKSPIISLREEKTPVRSSSRTAGKAFKFVDSPSEDDISGTGSDSSSSDSEQMHKAKKQKVNRNLSNMLDEAAVGSSFAISPNLGHDKTALTSNIQNTPSSTQKTASQKKSKAITPKSESLANTGPLVQSKMSSFLHKPEEKKLQSEKTPPEKGSAQRRQNTNAKGKSKKHKDAEEKLSEEEIVEEVHTVSKQGRQRRSGRLESASKPKQAKGKKKSSDVEEVSSESESDDDSDDDWAV